MQREKNKNDSSSENGNWTRGTAKKNFLGNEGQALLKEYKGKPKKDKQFSRATKPLNHFFLSKRSAANLCFR